MPGRRRAARRVVRLVERVKEICEGPWRERREGARAGMRETGARSTHLGRAAQPLGPSGSQVPALRWLRTLGSSLGLGVLTGRRGAVSVGGRWGCLGRGAGRGWGRALGSPRGPTPSPSSVPCSSPGLRSSPATLVL